MTQSRITWPRKSVAFLSLAAWMAASWAVLNFLLPLGTGVFWTALLLTAGGTGYLLVRFLKTFGSYAVHEGKLRIRRLAVTREYPLADLDFYRENPSGGVLVLGFSGKKVRIPRRITGLDSLAKNLREGFLPKEAGEDRFRIKAAVSPLVFYLVMEVLLAGFYMAVTGSVASGPGQTVLAGSVVLLGTFMMVRLLFLLPLEYVLDPEGIRVKYLLRRKYFPSAASLKLVEDLYFADGAPFHLVKLVFSRQNLVLDEFNLQSSLVPLLPWIRENYGPASRSTF